MRRLRILFFWLFVNKNNVGIKELIQFLFKPTIATIAGREIESIKETEVFEITFKSIPNKLYWPKSFYLNRLHQVVAETFDENDWHYYQKEHTEVQSGEILLDVGTAEGLFPLTVVDKCSHMYLVEPGKIFTDCLTRTFSPFKDKVTLINTAVGNQDGEISFDENSLDGKVSESGSIARISINRIDTLMKGKKITYLKADIEGFEEEMLRGAEETIKANKPKIAITTYHTENNPEDIISIIKGYVPEYKHYVKGIYEETPKPVMIHFWI